MTAMARLQKKHLFLFLSPFLPPLFPLLLCLLLLRLLLLLLLLLGKNTATRRAP